MDEVQEIQERNRKVELDKAWEMSLTRRSIIAGITYLVAVLFMFQIGIENAWFNAMVPTGGYILSTLSLLVVKKWWLNQKES